MVDFVRELQTTLRTGKITIGAKETIKLVLNGKPKLVIIAANARDDIRADLKRYCKLAKIPLYIFPGSSWELGLICKRPHMVSALAIQDPGESSILDIVEGGK